MSKVKDEVKNTEIQISKDDKDNKNRNFDTTSLKRLFSYLFDHKWQLIVVNICVILSALSQVYGISMMQSIIDNDILKADVDGLKSSVIKMAFVYLVCVITSFIYTRLMIRIGERSIRNLRRDLFAKVQKMPINFFDTNQHGQIMSRFTNDTDVLSQSHPTNPYKVTVNDDRNDSCNDKTISTTNHLYVCWPHYYGTSPKKHSQKNWDAI